jgi:hypothetical protein
LITDERLGDGGNAKPAGAASGSLERFKQAFEG